MYQGDSSFNHKWQLESFTVFYFHILLFNSVKWIRYQMKSLITIVFFSSTIRRQNWWERFANLFLHVTDKEEYRGSGKLQDVYL